MIIKDCFIPKGGAGKTTTAAAVNLVYMLMENRQHAVACMGFVSRKDERNES